MRIIADLTVKFPQLGACGNMTSAFQSSGNWIRIYSVGICISQCLADGFEHYSGDNGYPIAAPAGGCPKECYRDAARRGALWTGEYGGYRLAAVEHIKARAHLFRINDNKELCYDADFDLA